MPAAPRFEEVEPGVYEATGPGYHATLSDEEGLVYKTHNVRNPADPHHNKVQVQLRHIRRGQQVHYDRLLDGNDDIPVDDLSGGVSFWRAPGIDERYQPRGDGVEQTFSVQSRPEGEGDLEFVCSLGVENVSASPMRNGRSGGILFKEESGRVAARYGQIVVRDSEKNGCVIEPLLSADGSEIAFSVPAAFLDRAVYPVIVDPLVGGDFFISEDFPTLVTQPTIAASSTNFLVVWNDYRTGTVPQITASIVTPGGLPSANFRLSNIAAVPLDYRFQRISVASDGTNWLVVWSDDRAVGAGVRGAIVQSNGSLLGGDDFLIAATTGMVFEDPIVVYNGFEFVVSWTSTPPTGGTSQIFYTRVTSASVIGQTSVVPANITPINQTLLFLAPQKPNGDTLLVYRENAEAPAATRSVRIASDGTIRDVGGTVLFKEDQNDSGFGRPIGAAWTGTEWQILSTFDQTTDSSIFLHRLSTTGVITPPTGVFAEFGLGPLGTATEPYAPAFAGGNEWLFLRNERVSQSLSHIIGKRVTFAGIDRDPVPFQLDTATQGFLRDAVAAFVSDRYLAVWLDGRSGGAQPGDARDVAGTIIDTTVAGTADIPLVAVANASPKSGEPPLTVSFDATASTGTYDTLLWDFGDGTTSNVATVSKTYRTRGTFIAVLRLTKNGYTVSDRVIITVGSGGPNTGGSKVGTPVANSPGVETGLFLSTVVIRLNFAASPLDVIRVTGILDAGLLPNDLTGKNASVTIGSFTSTVSLDAKGQFKSPDVNFALNGPTGGFAFQIINADLRAAMAALGLNNEDVKPAKNIEIPVTVTVGDFSATATVAVAYRAVRNDNGVGSYAFLQQGAEVSGSFLITSFSATEQFQPKTGLKTHTFSIKGQIVQPSGGLFKPAAAGEFRFGIGNFEFGVPVGQFRVDGGKLKFVARVGVSGLKKFSIDLNSGTFNLQLLKVPAQANNGSGLFVAREGDNITNVDLALSFIFDLEKEKFSAGRYIFINRKDLKTKKWKLR